MRITLKNFRCYEDKTFDFGDNNGLVLLSGASGTGKTTILLAIQFALYGTGNKLQTFGKTSCSVELSFQKEEAVRQSLLIKRNKRPNRLVIKVDDQDEYEYEDDVAQEVLNKKFGSSFDVISYVSQNNLNSFILMSPLEKLAFLERFSFQGLDLSKIKAKCQSLIKKSNEDLIATSSQLELISEQIKTEQKPELILYPVKTQDRTKFKKNTETKIKNSFILIKRKEKEIQTLEKENMELKLIKNTITSLTDFISKSTSKLVIFQSELKEIPYEGDITVSNYEKQLEFILTNKNLFNLKEKLRQDECNLEDLQKKELSIIRNNIDELRETLKDFSLDETEKNIQDLISVQKIVEKNKILEKELLKNFVDEEKYKENLETLKKNSLILEEKKELILKLKKQTEIYRCPKCKSSLRFHESSLILEPFSELELTPKNHSKESAILKLEKECKKISQTVSELEKILPNENVKLQNYNETKAEKEKINSEYKETYETEMPDLQELTDNIDYHKEYKKENLLLKKKLDELGKRLENKIYSSTIENLANNIQKQKGKINEMEKKIINKIVTSQDEETLRILIQSQKDMKKKKETIERSIKILESEIEENRALIKEKELEHSMKYKTVKSDNDIEEQLGKLKDDLEELKRDLIKNQSFIERIEKYEKYMEESKRYKTMEKKISELSQKENELSQRLSASTRLKDKILQAESLAILRVIDSINSHVQEYLELFFPIDPIEVRLSTFKVSKKNTKPQINLEVDYKGNQCEISSLSGGEVSRVILAFTLALAEIFNSPIILLDECTASLDQELTSTVMEGIKEHFSDRLVIVIAHQVVVGNFDRHVQL